MKTEWKTSRWIPDDRNGNEIHIDACKPQGYAVRTAFGFCLNKKGLFEHEPIPSNRTNAFLKRCRFAGIYDAMEAYDKWKEAQQVIQPDSVCGFAG